MPITKRDFQTEPLDGRSSGLLDFYIIRQYGGAYQTYRYAQRKSIPIINVAKGASQCLK